MKKVAKWKKFDGSRPDSTSPHSKHHRYRAVDESSLPARVCFIGLAAGLRDPNRLSVTRWVQVLIYPRQRLWTLALVGSAPSVYNIALLLDPLTPDSAVLWSSPKHLPATDLAPMLIAFLIHRPARLNSLLWLSCLQSSQVEDHKVAISIQRDQERTVVTCIPENSSKLSYLKNPRCAQKKWL